jgi:monofunctional biosynthetic peptidoglycan transglycosylase
MNAVRTSVGIRVAQIGQWIRARPLRSSLYAIGLFFFVEYLSLPNNSLQSLRRENPGMTAMMEQRIEEARASGSTIVISQRWVPLSRISPNLVHAVIVSEDGSFYAHDGIDWYEMEESIRKNIEQGRPSRGGSTISQQLSKNLYLSTSKDPIRKLKELIITLRMEHILTKRRIIEIYLNIIEWGNGVFGAEAASLKYFGKHAADLSREESALLAAVIPNPRRFSASRPSRYIQRRASVILSRMSARGF